MLNEILNSIAKLIYGITSIGSLIVRNLLLPNPFESYPAGVGINFLVTGILHPMTFAIVGLFYIRGSFPAWGSVLYLIFYAANTVVLMLMGHYSFSVIACAIIGLAYGLLLGGLVPLRNWASGLVGW